MNVAGKFLWLITISLLSLNCHAVEVVKKSSSGICHSKDSPWYDKTKNFKAYASMDACIASGGRKTSATKRHNKPTSTKQYSRSDFPHWIDADSDCQDTRAEVLILQSQTPVEFTNNKKCHVTSGTWYDPYTDATYTDDDDLDVDHVVPLGWAFYRGGSNWPLAKRRKFANDFRNLIAVKNSANRAKGAKGPSMWLPPNLAYRCKYLERYTFIVEAYGLTFKPNEKRVVNKQLSACQLNPIT